MQLAHVFGAIGLHYSNSFLMTCMGSWGRGVVLVNGRAGQGAARPPGRRPVADGRPPPPGRGVGQWVLGRGRTLRGQHNLSPFTSMAPHHVWCSAGGIFRLSLSWQADEAVNNVELACPRSPWFSHNFERFVSHASSRNVRHSNPDLIWAQARAPLRVRLCTGCDPHACALLPARRRARPAAVTCLTPRASSAPGALLSRIPDGLRPLHALP